jgi:hypothetical protein
MWCDVLRILSSHYFRCSVGNTDCPVQEFSLVENLAPQRQSLCSHCDLEVARNCLFLGRGVGGRLCKVCLVRCLQNRVKSRLFLFRVPFCRAWTVAHPGEFLLPLDYRQLPLADFWRIGAYLWHRDSLFCDVGPSVELPAATSSGAAIHLLAKKLYDQEKAIRGAPPQHVDKVEQIILSSSAVESAIQEYADSKSCSLQEARRAAKRRFREMAGTFRGSVIAFFYLLFKPAIRAAFSSLQVEGLERVERGIARSPVVLLPSHRSHFDYVLVSYVLFMAKLPIPYVAAGINLNFWPFGPLARAAGGFFIRRQIGSDRLYRAVLDKYLRYLAKRGHMLEFFIEGGRSRTGGMRQPRIGLLKYLLEDGRLANGRICCLFRWGSRTNGW